MRGVFDAFNRREFDAALAVLDDSITWRPAAPEPTGLVRGKENLRAQWTSRVEALDLHVEPEELVPVGECGVVAVARWIGRGQMSGVSVEDTRILACTIQGGKVIRIEVCASKEEALEAAGQRE